MEQTTQPDTREPSRERRAALQAGYERNTAPFRPSYSYPPYANVSIWTYGEMLWICHERGWVIGEGEGEAEQQADFSWADLHQINLRGTKLSGVDFSEANMREAVLSEANLRGAQFYRTHLNDAELRGADLSDALFLGADLQGANLEGADLSGADF